MKRNISVVMITKNEENILGQTLQAVQSVTDDIIIMDTGSKDATLEIGKSFNASIFESTWLGFGPTKNLAITHAKHDWILNLDADEELSPGLIEELNKLELSNESVVYEMKFVNYYLNKPLHWGHFKGDKHVRLFNKKTASWNDALVHENLTYKSAVTTVLLQNPIQHHTVRTVDQILDKIVRYSRDTASKSQAKGKKANLIKMVVAPPFHFLNSYIFRLGFLDGYPGFVAAAFHSIYKFLKVFFLYELNKEKNA
jgi:glycosyltransferase involved in cell wall biosynthesis